MVKALQHQKHRARVINYMVKGHLDYKHMNLVSESMSESQWSSILLQKHNNDVVQGKRDNYGCRRMVAY